MANEIERKWFVRSPEWEKQSQLHYAIVQGYLATSDNATVRVRNGDKGAQICIKSRNSGMTRYEFEQRIEQEDADAMMRLCDTVISKTRHLVPYGGRTFEVDVFHGPLQGFVMAELELESEDAEFALPEWLGREVTRYRCCYNEDLAQLVKDHPNANIYSLLKLKMEAEDGR